MCILCIVIVYFLCCDCVFCVLSLCILCVVIVYFVLWLCILCILIVYFALKWVCKIRDRIFHAVRMLHPFFIYFVFENVRKTEYWSEMSITLMGITITFLWCRWIRYLCIYRLEYNIEEWSISKSISERIYRQPEVFC